MVTFDAGQFDRKITIQVNTPTQGATGEDVDSWATYATPWAKVIHKQGKEFFKSDHVQADVDTLFRIRYQSGITRQMRVLYNGEYYDIFDTAEIDRAKYLEIMARLRRA